MANRIHATIRFYGQTLGFLHHNSIGCDEIWSPTNVYRPLYSRTSASIPKTKTTWFETQQRFAIYFEKRVMSKQSFKATGIKTTKLSLMVFRIVSFVPSVKGLAGNKTADLRKSRYAKEETTIAFVYRSLALSNRIATSGKYHQQLQHLKISPDNRIHSFVLIAILLVSAAFGSDTNAELSITTYMYAGGHPGALSTHIITLSIFRLLIFTSAACVH